MLITTIDELRSLTSIGQGNSLESYQVDLSNAEQDHLQPLLGDALYAQLLSDYADNSINTEPDQTLITLCQAVIANMAVASNLDQRQVEINDSGVTRSEVSAYHYQKIEAQNSFTRRGYRAMDQLLSFLEKNIVSYPDWASSDAYYLNRSHIIPSAADFQQEYNIRNSRRTFLAMQPIMKKVERFSMVETLGKDFYDELILTVQNDPGLTNTVKEQNRQLMRDYLRPAVAYLTVSEAVHELSLSLDANGLYLTENLAGSDKTIEQRRANDQQLALHAQQCSDTGQQYLQRAVSYLNQNAADDLFPKYLLSQSWIAANPEPENNHPKYERETKPKKRLYGL